VFSDINVATDGGKCTVLLVLDISTAFDAVDHTIMCEHARADFGIDGAALNDCIHLSPVSRSPSWLIVSQRRQLSACLASQRGPFLDLDCFCVHFVSP